MNQIYYIFTIKTKIDSNFNIMASNERINVLIERQRSVLSAEDFWAGDTYSTKIDSLSEEEFFMRPIPELHTVAELLSHVMAWRRDSMGKISGNRPNPLGMDSPENWIPNEELRRRGWGHLKGEFYKSVDELCELLSKRDDDFLSDRPQGENRSFGFILNGLIDHDIYHLGQLGLLVKLIRSRDRE